MSHAVKITALRAASARGKVRTLAAGDMASVCHRLDGTHVLMFQDPAHGQVVVEIGRELVRQIKANSLT